MPIFTHKNIYRNPFSYTIFYDKAPKIPSSFFSDSATYTLVLLLVTACASAQNKIAEYKIDPAFRYIMSATKERTAVDIHNLSLFGKSIVVTKGFASPDASVEERYECIVHTKDAKSLNDSGIILRSALPTLATAWVTLDQIKEMASMPQVLYIEAPEIFGKTNDISVGSSGASLLHQGRLNNTVYKGKNVIIAIYDTGIDWKHPDFRNPDDTTKSRILRIWDQTLTPVAGETAPSGFSYGVEYTQTQINNEIDGTPANFVREKDIDGHGTHVAGTAVGNGKANISEKYKGVAPEADIVVIKGGDSTFSDTRTIDAMTYLKTLSSTLGKPVVLNLSIGSLFGPHDGTRPQEVAIDNFSASAPGRAVAISAGNDNGTNRHNQLNLAANQSSTITFNVPAITSGSDVFAYRVYSNTNGGMNATFATPASGSVTALSGQTLNKTVINDNFTAFITSSTDPNDNNSYVDVSIARNGSNSASPEGTYTLTVTNNSNASIKLDGWLYNVNKSFQQTSLVNGDNRYLVSSPGNATSAITVGSFVGRYTWFTASNTGRGLTREREDSISSFSSNGPRRDNVIKPEITADGQEVASCLSSTITKVDSNLVVEKGLYFLNSGTSMATPAVSGAIALLLQANTNATAVQLKTLLTANATKGGMTELTGALPNNTWGYGKLDVFRAASALFNCAPADRRTFKNDSSTRGSELSGYLFSTERFGVRFTPDISGKLGGIYYQTVGAATNTIFEIRTSNSGTPGTVLGTLTIPANLLQKYSWNYLDMSSLNVSIASGVDYFVVLYRDPSSTTNSSIGAEKIVVNNRSIVSTNGGTSWSAVTANLKIRSVVYNNGQLSGAIATANSNDTRNIISSNQFINSNCQLIDQVVPSGLNPVTGSVTSKVWIEGAVPKFNNNPYVQRHYEITPVTSTSFTGKITLYFTQAEFTAFNNDPGSTLDLPANPNDAAGKTNLRILKLSGTSSDNTGLPGSYSGASTLIDPADGDIIWNAEANRWEVTFDVTGFGGFIVQTSTTGTTTTPPVGPGNNTNITRLYSTVLTPRTSVTVTFTGTKGSLVIYDGIGRMVSVSTLANGTQSLKPGLVSAGIYYYVIVDDTTKILTGKIVVQ